MIRRVNEILRCVMSVLRGIRLPRREQYLILGSVKANRVEELASKTEEKEEPSLKEKENGLVL